MFLINIIISYSALKNREKASNIKTGILLSIYLIVTNLTSNFLYMGLEVRMYSWAMFFVTLSGIYAYKLYNKINKKNVIIFILVSLSAALTHYFALIMEIVIYLFLFLILVIKDKKNIKGILIISLITILGYSWWLPKALYQFTRVNNNFWLTFTPKDVLKYIKSILGLNFNIVIEIMIMLFLFIIGLYILYKLIIKKNIRSKEKQEVIFGLFLTSFPFLIILIGTILNIIIRPIFTNRYLMPSLNLFWLGIIILINYIDYKKIVISLLSIIVIAMSVTAYKDKYNAELKTGTDDTIYFIEQRLQENDIIETNISHLAWTVLKYYFPNNKIKEMNYNQLQEENNTIWYFASRFTETDKNKVIKNGYKVELMYKGNIDNAYYFEIYKLDKVI